MVHLSKCQTERQSKSGLKTNVCHWMLRDWCGLGIRFHIWQFLFDLLLHLERDLPWWVYDWRYCGVDGDVVLPVELSDALKTLRVLPDQVGGVLDARQFFGDFAIINAWLPLAAFFLSRSRCSFRPIMVSTTFNWTWWHLSRSFISPSCWTLEIFCSTTTVYRPIGRRLAFEPGHASSCMTCFLLAAFFHPFQRRGFPVRSRSKKSTDFCGPFPARGGSSEPPGTPIATPLLVLCFSDWFFFPGEVRTKDLWSTFYVQLFTYFLRDEAMERRSEWFYLLTFVSRPVPFIYIPPTGNECGRKPIAMYVISMARTLFTGAPMVVKGENP